MKNPELIEIRENEFHELADEDYVILKRSVEECESSEIERLNWVRCNLIEIKIHPFWRFVEYILRRLL
jgi:hypothetical protein